MAKKWALDDRAQLHKDANKPLDENLMSGKPVKVIVRGQHDSAVIATDRRIFVFKKGLFSGAAMAKKLSSWDCRNVTSVQVETGVLGGTLVIQAAGAQATDAGYWSGGKNNARHATNAIALVSGHFEQAKRGWGSNSSAHSRVSGSRSSHTNRGRATRCHGSAPKARRAAGLRAPHAGGVRV